MNAVWALFRREARLLVASPAGLMVVGLWAFLCGAVFLMELLAFEQAEQRALALDDPAILALVDVNDLLLASVQHHQLVILLFLAPLLAMRLWGDAESRGWLLQRSPSLLAFVVARSLAAAAAVLALVAVSSLLTILVGAIATPTPGATGSVLDVAQACTAAGTVWAVGTALVLVASLAVVAVDQALAGALVAFVALAIWWLLPSAAVVAGPSLAEVLAFLSPAGHVASGLRGVVDGGDIAFLVSAIAAAVAGTVGILGARR